MHHGTSGVTTGHHVARPLARDRPTHHLESVKFLAFADDVCIVAGVCLCGVGIYQVCPVATWFYAGLSLVALGLLIARVPR